jgi:hypothetical protein
MHRHLPTFALTAILLAACSEERTAQAAPAAPTAPATASAKPAAPAPAPAAPAKPAPAPAPAATTPAAADAAPAASQTAAVAVVAAAPSANAPAAKPAGVDAVIPHATAKFTIDGDGGDWSAIPALPAPYSHKDTGSLKLAWREDGLYGYVEVADASIEVDEATPWSADTLELWLDPTGKRGPDMDDSHQVAIAPNPLAGAGECVLVVSQGQIDANAVKRTWKARPGGYAIEFFIPAAELKPAKLEAGSKLGFSYSIDDDGKAIEQFVHDKDTDEGYHNPSTWGLIVLE